MDMLTFTRLSPYSAAIPSSPPGRRGRLKRTPISNSRQEYTSELEVMHKTLAELQFNMQVYLTSWQTMCRASAAIAKGLAKLAKGSDGAGGAGGDNDGVKDKQGVSPLVDMARLYDSAHRAIDSGVREPTHRQVSFGHRAGQAEHTTLRETGALLSRFPPIFAKVTRRKQVLADVEAAKSRVRTAEAARVKERDSFAVVAGKEHRRRMSDALATAVAVADGVTAEVVADAERLEREREAMLVPQVSALVGGQAFFMQRSATVLEKLAAQLPHSALALCQLLGPRPTENPSAPPPLPRRSSIQQTLSPSVAPVDLSGHSAGSSSTVVRGFDGGGSGGGGSSSSTIGLVSPHQQAATITTPALSPPGLQPHGAMFEPVGLLPTGSSASSPPPPPAAVGTPDRSQSCSRPNAMARGDPASTSKRAEAMDPAAAAAAAAAPAAPLLPPRPEISGGRAGGDGKR
ncbi:unnamed protein product [Ectocarpus sp. 4 AP-2014]